MRAVANTRPVRAGNRIDDRRCRLRLSVPQLLVAHIPLNLVIDVIGCGSVPTLDKTAQSKVELTGQSLSEL